MATLASATLDLARTLANCDVIEGTATGGSATTMVDAAFPLTTDTSNTAPAADRFNGGTIWILSGDNAGKVRQVTDWAVSTQQGTATFLTMTSSVASGNDYALCDWTYPYYALKMAVNAALRSIGDIGQINTATTTTSNQINYDLPASVYNVKQVWEARSTSSPYGYKLKKHWKEIDDDIYFLDGTQPLSTDHILKLCYEVPHAHLDDDTDTISTYIHKDWLSWEAAVHAYRWKLGREGISNPLMQTFMEEAIRRASIERARHEGEIPRFSKTPIADFHGTAEVSDPTFDGTVRV